MTNNDQGGSIFKELLAYAIGDRFTPWRWENYTPITGASVRQCRSLDADEYIRTLSGI